MLVTQHGSLPSQGLIYIYIHIYIYEEVHTALHQGGNPTIQINKGFDLAEKYHKKSY